VEKSERVTDDERKNATEEVEERKAERERKESGVGRRKLVSNVR